MFGRRVETKEKLPFLLFLLRDESTSAQTAPSSPKRYRKSSRDGKIRLPVPKAGLQNTTSVERLQNFPLSLTKSAIRRPVLTPVIEQKSNSNKYHTHRTER